MKLTTKQNVPDGIYNGKQTAYQVVYVADGEFITAECDTGVRGIDCLCSVIVKNGEATIEDREPTKEEWEEHRRKRRGEV